MAILPILTVPHPILRQKAKRVPRIDRSIHTLLDDMVDTMRNAFGVGLAANQVGQLLRVITIELPPEDEDAPEGERGQLYRLVNPQIVRRTGTREVEEGCLSVPGYRGFINRSVRVTIKALSDDSKEVRIKAEDILAQALEHEIDHLNGILYLDHLESHEKLEKLEAAATPSSTE